MKYFENWQISAGGRSQVNYRNVLLMLYFYFKKVKNKWKIKKMNKWKDHFQYLISFDLLSAKERLPNALNDACCLLLGEKTIIQSKMRTVYETSLLSLLSLFLFSFITPISSLKISKLRYQFAPCALYHTNKRLQYLK